jgi:hypothetical protein
MDLPKLRELVAFCGKDSSMHNTTWMANGILETWLAAASNDPNAFAVTVKPHDQLTDVMSCSASSKMADIRLFLEWSMLSQFLWDQAFAASIVGRSSGTATTLLVRYSKALIDAYNNQEHDSAVSNKWGYVSSVYRSPFLAVWRPLPDEVISTATPPFAAFSLATQSEISSGNFPVILFASPALHGTQVHENNLSLSNLQPSPFNELTRSGHVASTSTLLLNLPNEPSLMTCSLSTPHDLFSLDIL